MEQVVRAFSQSMASRIEHQRSWVKGHLAEKSTLQYDTTEGKLSLLQGILDNGYYQKNQTMELQSLGVTFGDALQQTLDLEWVEVEDEYGVDPALRHRDVVTYKNILLFPLTMLSKRIENGETVDVGDLFRNICDQIKEITDEKTAKG